MNREISLLAGGIGIGATLMYIFDPDKGKRRRALARDKVLSLKNHTPDAIGVIKRDFSNRARGLAAQARSIFKSEDISDDVLVSRVRSKIGRTVSHPHAIEVTINQGNITLSGQILADEVNDLISCVSAVSGAREVDNQLEIHEEAGNVPSLQGGRQRSRYRFELLQENWSPTARVLVGVAGGACILYCLSRRNALGTTLGTLGFRLLTRSVTNTEFKSLVGAGGKIGNNKDVESQKNIETNAQPHKEAEGQTVQAREATIH